MPEPEDPTRDLALRPLPDGCALPVRARPRSRADAISGIREGRLVVQVTAPPDRGKANAAVCRLLAEVLGVPPGSVAVVRGAASRDKVVALPLDPDEARRRLARHPALR